VTAAAPTLRKMLQEIYYKVNTSLPNGVDVSPHWRKQGDALPAVVYEVSSADWVSLTTQFANAANVVIAFSCIAMTLDGAIDLADYVKKSIENKTTRNGITFCATAISYRVSDLVPDDGTGDRDRVVVVTATIFAQDEN